MDTYHIHNIARIICVRDGLILLAWHKKHQYYFLPGGHIEPGESSAVAVVRECKEEFLGQVTCERFILLFEHAWTNGDAEQHELTIIFSATWDGNSVSPVSQVEHLEFRWIPLEEFATVHFLPRELHEATATAAKGESTPSFITTMK